MTQPVNGQVTDYTWAETMDQARRMAAHLNSLNLPANSNIAMISKNCAHFVIAELAIWMAGHCTVALYPTLNADTVEYILDHSESQLLFVGKLDEWEEMKPGVKESLPKIALPLAPANDYDKWDDIVARNEPIADVPEWPADQRAPDLLHLRQHRPPQGRGALVRFDLGTGLPAGRHFSTLPKMTVSSPTCRSLT